VKHSVSFHRLHSLAALSALAAIRGVAQSEDQHRAVTFGVVTGFGNKVHHGTANTITSTGQCSGLSDLVCRLNTASAPTRLSAQT
jgi:hypothetical protein